MSTFPVVSNQPFSLFFIIFHIRRFLVFQYVILGSWAVHNIEHTIRCIIYTRLVESDHNCCKIFPLVPVISVHMLDSIFLISRGIGDPCISHGFCLSKLNQKIDSEIFINIQKPIWMTRCQLNDKIFLFENNVFPLWLYQTSNNKNMC